MKAGRAIEHAPERDSRPSYNSCTITTVHRPTRRSWGRTPLRSSAVPDRSGCSGCGCNWGAPRRVAASTRPTLAPQSASRKVPVPPTTQQSTAKLVHALRYHPHDGPPQRCIPIVAAHPATSGLRHICHTGHVPRRKIAGETAGSREHVPERDSRPSYNACRIITPVHRPHQTLLGAHALGRSPSPTARGAQCLIETDAADLSCGISLQTLALPTAYATRHPHARCAQGPQGGRGGKLFSLRRISLSRPTRPGRSRLGKP